VGVNAGTVTPSQTLRTAYASIGGTQFVRGSQVTATQEMLLSQAQILPSEPSVLVISVRYDAPA
jgi:hypothetical protein